jgi:Fe-S-cluster-containing dehydrogenase component
LAIRYARNRKAECPVRIYLSLEFVHLVQKIRLKSCLLCVAVVSMARLPACFALCAGKASSASASFVKSQGKFTGVSSVKMVAAR